MKKFFKILRKIIKILLKIILRLILGIIVIVAIGLVIINNRTLKFYEDNNYKTKFTMNENFRVENGTEIILNLGEGTIIEKEIYKGKTYNKDIMKINLKKGIITFDGINFKNPEIPRGYTETQDTIKFKKLNFQDIRQSYKNGDIENWFEILRFFVDGEAIEYYDNGQISDKGIYVNGLRNGPYVSYYKNGQIKEEWNYINGITNGTLTGYFEDGNIQYIGNSKSGKLYGRSIFYRDDGSYTEIDANDGTGFITIYDEKNNIKIKYGFITDEYNNIIENGNYIHYFDNGKITEGYYINGKKNGSRTGYYENNSIRFLGNFENGSGIILYYDENGNFIGTGNIFYGFNQKNGNYELILNGLDISLYNNGQIYQISNYNNGELNGFQTGYYDNGQISSVCNYVNGYKSGECNTYYKNGQIRDNGEYKVEKIGYYNNDNNEPMFHSYGTHTYYYDNGDFLGDFNEVCTHKSGNICVGSKETGIMKINYYPSLEIKEKILYSDYNYHSIKNNEIQYYENGNIREEGFYKNGLKNGIWTEYYENGNIKEEGFYKNGLKNGIWTEYYENGNLKAKGNYENGEKIGIRNWFLGDGSIGVSKNFDE